MVQGRRLGGHDTDGAGGGVALCDAAGDGVPADDAADALRRRHGPLPQDGTVDARGADDDTLHGDVPLPRAAHAELRPAAAAPPGDPAAAGVAGMDGLHVDDLGDAVGVNQIHAGEGVVCGAVLLRGMPFLPKPPADTPVLLGLRHRPGGGHTDFHLQDAGQLQRPADAAPRDETLLQRPYSLRLRHSPDAAGRFLFHLLARTARMAPRADPPALCRTLHRPLLLLLPRGMDQRGGRHRRVLPHTHGDEGEVDGGAVRAGRGSLLHVPERRALQTGQEPSGQQLHAGRPGEEHFQYLDRRLEPRTP